MASATRAAQAQPGRSAAVTAAATRPSRHWVRKLFSRRQTVRMPAKAKPRRARKDWLFTGRSSRTIAPPFMTSRTRADRVRCRGSDRRRPRRDRRAGRGGPRRPVGEMEDAGIARGGGDQHVGGAHAPGRHQLHLARILAMGEDADVAAHADRDARRQRRGEAGALVAHRLGLGRGAGPAAIAGDRVGRGEGRAERGAVRPHQRGRFRACRHCHARSCRRRRGWRGACLRGSRRGRRRSGRRRAPTSVAARISSMVKVGRLGSPGRQR